jgi:RNA polymerase sigma-70 factor (ECF subfamily)
LDLDDAFASFLAHHQDMVYGIAWRMTGRAADAEDLAQDAFVRAYRAMRAYPPARIRELRARSWMAAIVANAARDQARRRRPSDVSIDDETTLPLLDPRAGPDALAVRREAARAWAVRLAALPVRYRAAVGLRHVQGMSYPEVAAALGRPVGTVKSDVHRGVRLLREAWLREQRMEIRSEARA